MSSAPGPFREALLREGLLSPAELLHRGQTQQQSMLSLLHAPCEGRWEYGLMQRRMQQRDEGRGLQGGI